jgi:hypothetical protein
MISSKTQSTRGRYRPVSTKIRVIAECIYTGRTKEIPAATVVLVTSRELDLLNMNEKEMPAEANRIVKSILDKHQVESIAEDLIEKGDAIIEKYEDMVRSSDI